MPDSPDLTVQLALAAERIKNLEDLNGVYRERLRESDFQFHDLLQNYKDLTKMLPALPPPEQRRSPWWRFWSRLKG